MIGLSIIEKEYIKIPFKMGIAKGIDIIGMGLEKLEYQTAIELVESRKILVSDIISHMYLFGKATISRFSFFSILIL